MNRVSRLLLVGYLYLHLGVLFLLTRGPGSRTSVVAPFKNPYFPGLESLLILVILVHALNGLRLALVGSGAGVSHQKVLVRVGDVGKRRAHRRGGDSSAGPGHRRATAYGRPLAGARC